MARTKQQIVDVINNSPLVQQVIDPALVETSNNVNLYEYLCMVGDENEVVRQKVIFYVYDEGGANEAAWFKNNEEDSITPKSTAVYDTVKTYLDNNLGATIGGNIFIKYANLKANEKRTFATVDVYLDTGTTITKKSYFIWNDGGIKFKELV